MNLLNKNSMLYWYPMIDGKVPTPRTVMLEIPFANLYAYIDKPRVLDAYRERILECGKMVRYPLFLRTDLCAGKHNWKDTCYVPSEDVLFSHIRAVCEENALADIIGLNMRALVFREFLHLKTAFRDFHDMPIAREFRCFADTGKLKCIHPYWPEDAIEFWVGTAEPEGWRRKLKDMSKLDMYSGERWKLQALAEHASGWVGGEWSVDLCQTEDERWYLTDMAVASESYHHPHKEAERLGVKA